MTNTRIWTFVLRVFAIWVFAVGSWTIYRIIPESSPVARGAEYVLARGCTECHVDLNYLQTGANIMDCSNNNRWSWHPEYSVNCKDVLAYFGTIHILQNNDSRLQNEHTNSLVYGEYLARKYYCFNCHGQLGQGGFRNKGSLKGYVPGYFGKDFRLLTRNGNPESLREWIMLGMDSSILKKPITGRIAKYFFDRQEISMPSFNSLDPGEVAALIEYVIALNEIGPMSLEKLRQYSSNQ